VDKVLFKIYIQSNTNEFQLSKFHTSDYRILYIHENICMSTKIKHSHLLGRLRTFGETGSTFLGSAAPVLHEFGQKSGSSVFKALAPSHINSYFH